MQISLGRIARIPSHLTAGHKKRGVENLLAVQENHLTALFFDFCIYALRQSVF